MFIIERPDRRIKDPFLGRLYYYLFMIPFFTLANATMVYSIHIGRTCVSDIRIIDGIRIYCHGIKEKGVFEYEIFRVNRLWIWKD